MIGLTHTKLVCGHCSVAMQTHKSLTSNLNSTTSPTEIATHVKKRAGYLWRLHAGFVLECMRYLCVESLGVDYDNDVKGLCTMALLHSHATLLPLDLLRPGKPWVLGLLKPRLSTCLTRFFSCHKPRCWRKLVNNFPPCLWYKSRSRHPYSSFYLSFRALIQIISLESTSCVSSSLVVCLRPVPLHGPRREVDTSRPFRRTSSSRRRGRVCDT
jgi:hypothetical protein